MLHKPIPDEQHRHIIRLHDYDYTNAGAYYVTICTVQKQCTFGEVVDGQVCLNEYGRVVEEEWARTAIVRPYVVLDAFVVMPNHVHGVIIIADDEGGDGQGTARRAPTGLHNPYGVVRQFGQAIPGSLSTIVGAFKSAVTRRVNLLRDTPGEPLWQRNFYEHIIRDETELDHAREYIANNPANWSNDKNNPVNW